MPHRKIKFYKTHEPYGAFSNFSRHAIFVDDKIWKTSEHYFQAMKFKDSKVQERVRLAKSPAEAAAIGRDRTLTMRERWDEEWRTYYMERALKAKFTQHPDLLALLLGTGEAELIEHTTKDSYWGDGGDGFGVNMLGKLLMKIRKVLAKEESYRF